MAPRTEPRAVIARIRPGSQWDGSLSPLVMALVLLGAVAIGLSSPDVAPLVPIAGLLTAIAYVWLFFRQPIHIFLLLIRNVQRPGRPLLWCSDGNLTLLDSGLFCEPISEVRLELSEHDGGRVTYFRFIGKGSRATIWTGYFKQTVEEVMSEFRVLQGRTGNAASFSP